MPQVYAQDKCLTVRQLQEAAQPAAIPYFETLPSYFQDTLTFCWQWLHGQDTFRLHTSGSTGTPKPIAISRQSMLASARMTLRALSLEASDTALVCLNTAYIAGKMMLVRALEGGMDMVVAEPASLPWTTVPRDVTIRFTALVPLQVQTMLEHPDPVHAAPLNQLHALLVGGAPVSYALQQQIARQIKAPVYATYGMTETVSHIALRQLNDPPDEDYTVLEDIQVAVDARSCLTIAGPVTNHRVIVTNDLVELTGPRRFRWIGRADHVINTGGHKVSPEKVEAVIVRIFHQEGVDRPLLVSSLPDERLGNRLVLLLEGDALTHDQHRRLGAALAAQLHPYERPKGLIYVPAFAVTPTGKVQRATTGALAQPYPLHPL